MDESFDNPGVTNRGWFRPAVAAWFALLLGGGLWLMPASIHASIAQATGLAALSPMFAAPVSAGGKAVLAATAGLLGAALGWVAAHRIALSATPRGFAPGFAVHGEDAWDEAEEVEQPRRRRVFSAREDIGEEGIAISAPLDEDAGYEREFEIADIPPVTPEESFEAVYAGMDADYVPPEEDTVVAEEVEPAAPVEYEAEFVEIEEEEAPPETEWPSEPEVETPPIEDASYGAVESEAPEHEPDADEEAPSQPLGDMSLDALLGRLAGAIEAHQDMVAQSERAAEEPAPLRPPMPAPRPAPEPTPEPQVDTAPETAHTPALREPEDTGLPEAADDDPVIAFLRREANRRMPQRAANEDTAPPEDDEETGEEADEPPAPVAPASRTEAQAALRSALDRLGQTGHRD